MKLHLVQFCDSMRRYAGPLRVKKQLGILMAFAVTFSAGCAALPGFSPAPLDTYELTAPETTSKGRRLRHRQALIAEPSALKVLDGENIVIRTSPTSLQFLEGAQWADRLPKIVQTRLLEVFQSSNRLGGVGKPGEGLAVDFQIISEIRAFEIRVNGSEKAHIEISIKILNDRNGVVRAQREFSSDFVVAGTGNDAYVSALDRAFGQIAAEIVDWSVQVM